MTNKSQVKNAVQEYREWYAFHMKNQADMGCAAIAKSAETLNTLKAAAMVAMETNKMGV